MPAVQSKSWCFTWNNYTAEDVEAIKKLVAEGIATYACWGKEVAPTTSTPHLQGYLVFRRKISLAGAKRHLHRNVHLERARGNPASNIEYCSKDGEFEDVGTRPAGQGSRADLVQVQDRIKAGGTLADIQDEFFGLYARYPRALESYCRRYAPVRTQKSRVIVLWGEPGTGKTRSVYDFHSHDAIWSSPGNGWFDGYDGHTVALFDDFSGGDFKLSYLLKLLDRYPMQVPVKGGFVQWRPEVIYITSNINPDDWFPNVPDIHKRALKRRFDRVTHFE